MHNLIALITLLSLALFFWMTVAVASARGRYDVPAPAVSGHPQFERYFRVQANTLEGLVLFLPSLWIFALSLNAALRSDWGDRVGAGLGLLWLLGRIIYMRSYVQDPARRALGFSIQALATVILLGGGIIALLWALFNSIA